MHAEHVARFGLHVLHCSTGSIRHMEAMDSMFDEFGQFSFLTHADEQVIEYKLISNAWAYLLHDAA